MNVLIACEFSGVVRAAFRRRGHQAWSCDLLESEDQSPHHEQVDCLELIGYPHWDLIIAHPPCTYLCNSGVRWLYADGTKDRNRWRKMRKAAHLFSTILHVPCPRVAVENPIMHGHASSLFDIGKPAQIIQPWQFGHGELKATGLWLRGLPNLTPTRVVSGRLPRVHHASPSPNRWRERSRTLTGVAEAMADQWGSL